MVKVNWRGDPDASQPTCRGGGMNSVSAGDRVEPLSALPVRLACSIRSLREETKFHQIWRPFHRRAAQNHETGAAPGADRDAIAMRPGRPKLVAIVASHRGGPPLLGARCALSQIPVADLRHERLLLDGGGLLLGPLIASHLAAATEVIVAVWTVGDTVTGVISERFSDRSGGRWRWRGGRCGGRGARRKPCAAASARCSPG